LSENYPGIRHSQEINELFTDDSLEALVIATPPDTHEELTIRALESGKHVFVEKPLTKSYEAARSVVELALTNRLQLHVGHVFLFHPAFERVRSEIGTTHIDHIEGCWRKFGTFDELPVWNLMVHDVAIALSLMGSAPDQISVTRAEGILTEVDLVQLVARFGGGTAMDLSVDRASPTADKVVSIKLADGRYFVWRGDDLYLARGTDGFEPVPTQHGEPLEREILAFLRAVGGESPELDEGDLATMVVGVLEEIQVQVDGFSADASR
jgi:predicted dehydrogenase